MARFDAREADYNNFYIWFSRDLLITCVARRNLTSPEFELQRVIKMLLRSGVSFYQVFNPYKFDKNAKRFKVKL